MENFKAPVPLDWLNQRVLTTAQLAEYYGCEVNNIKKNFNANKSRFKEGKHYFKLEGNSLEKLRVTFGDLQISPMTRTLYLWTERGAARHAKMLSTDIAWEVFELLEDNYFIRNTSVTAETKPAPVRTPNPKRRAAQLADARVYVASMSNATIKIGNSKDVRDRKSRIQTQYKLTVKKVHKTSSKPRKIARAIEKALHDIFSPFKVDGEFFNVEYEFACLTLDILEEIFDTFQLDSNTEPELIGNTLD